MIFRNGDTMHRILIIDDSTDLLETMEHILKYKRNTVKSLNNALDIKKEIKDFQPDVIILDIYLADEDGRNICKKLKDDKDFMHIPIIVFSASPESLEDHESYCADGVLEKPFDLTQLIEKITSVLHLAKTDRNF